MRRRDIPNTDKRIEIKIEATDTHNIVKELRKRTRKYRRCHFVVHVKDIDTFMYRRPIDWLRWQHANTIELKLLPPDLDKNE